MNLYGPGHLNYIGQELIIKAYIYHEFFEFMQGVLQINYN